MATLLWLRLWRLRGLVGMAIPLTTAGYNAPAGGFGYSSAYVAPGAGAVPRCPLEAAISGSTRSRWLTRTACGA